jgi:hypothetical protein
MIQLSDTEKQELRNILLNPIFKRSFEDAMRRVWNKKRGAETLEGAAMAYNHQSGASDLVDELFALAELKEKHSVPMRKLKH